MATEHGIDLAHSVMVGDRWRDIEAGQAARLPTVFVDRGYDEPRPPDAEPRGGRAGRRRAVDPRDDFERTTAMTAIDGSAGEDLRRRRRHRRHRRGRRGPHDRGLHDEPDADAPGRRRRLRAVRPEGARGHRRQVDLVRGVHRRVRRDGAPGPPHRLVGRQRVRQDPGDEHDGSSQLRPHRPARRRRRQRQRDGHVHPRPDRRSSSPASPVGRRATSRCSPAASPMRARTRCRTSATPSTRVARARRDRGHLGQPPGGAQRRAGRRVRLPHHHDDPTC